MHNTIIKRTIWKKNKQLWRIVINLNNYYKNYSFESMVLTKEKHKDI